MADTITVKNISNEIVFLKEQKKRVLIGRSIDAIEDAEVKKYMKDVKLIKVIKKGGQV